MNRISFSTGVVPELLLSNYQVCHSNNLEEVRSSGTKILCENDLRINDISSGLDASFYYRKIGDVGVGRISYGGDITIRPAIFEDFLLIQIPIRVCEYVELGQQKILCNPQNISIINTDIKTVINHQPDTEKLVIRIDKKLIEKNCQQILNRSLKQNIQFHPTISLDTPSGSQFLRMMSWIYEFVSTEQHLSPLMVSQIESNIVNMLLTYQHHTYSEEIHQEGPSIAPSFIKRLEHYIQENAHKPLAIQDMVEYTGISSRSLFTGFRKYRNTTPMRYLKDVRLQYAYDDLKKGKLGQDKVTTIAFKWGFTHLGYFSSDYKQHFGETPYETLSH